MLHFVKSIIAFFIKKVNCFKSFFFCKHLLPTPIKDEQKGNNNNRALNLLWVGSRPIDEFVLEYLEKPLDIGESELGGSFLDELAKGLIRIQGLEQVLANLRNSLVDKQIELQLELKKSSKNEVLIQELESEIIGLQELIADQAEVLKNQKNQD